MSSQSLSYKYDAEPTKANKKELMKHFEIHKDIYNKGLETLNKSNEWIPRYKMYNRLPEWKKTSNPEFQLISQGVPYLVSEANKVGKELAYSQTKHL